MTGSSRKAETVSLIALLVSFVFFVSTLLLGVFQEVLGIYLFSWLMLASVMIWLVLLIQFKHRTRAEQEKLDMAQLAKTDQHKTIFSSGGDRAALMAVAQKRLATLEKWFLPLAGVAIAVYEILVGIFLYRNKVFGVVEWSPANPLLGAVLMVVVAFVLFLFRRFASWMSSQTDWKPLRAGGSYLLVGAVIGFLLAVGLALAQFKYGVFLRFVEILVPGLMIVLGAETILNTIFDVYRPRVTGQYSRAAFDSRLLGLFSEPGGFLHTIAHTIDYQFGFQVSQTWFYKLLERAILPLILFAAVTMYCISSLVVIGPGQMAIVERFGSPQPDRGGRTIGPGLSVKWPWPIEIAYVYPTDKIQEITVGYRIEDTDEARRKPLLWGEEHYLEEYDLLAAAQSETADEEGVVPVSIIRANIPIQYRIRNLRDYLYNHETPEDVLEAICYRELVRFVAASRVEAEDRARPGVISPIGKNLLGEGRLEASRELQRRIQKAADSAGLGVEIVFLGLQGIHPPPPVVPEYQEVIAAIQGRQASVLNARAESNRVLTELAGSIEQVNELYKKALAFGQAREQGDTAQAEALRVDLRESFSAARGQVFKTLRLAEADAFVRINEARGEGLRFGGQLKAYSAAPELYPRLLRLATLEEALEKIRKYVVVADPQDAQVFIVDLQERLMPSLYDLDLGLDDQ
ncbi:MAG TPA: protease modulator HflK [Phycisphaerales bacterium]|nr:protease modulator HflK [Phycisphaerales bacterium]